MIYTLHDIVLAGNEHNGMRRDTIYAKLVDPDGHVRVDGTLEYTLAKIRDDNLTVKNVTVHNKKAHKVPYSEVRLKNI